MNVLSVGDKSVLLEHVRKLRRFLIVDEGSLIDALDFPPLWQITELDFDHDTFNPLRRNSYRKSEDIAAIVDAAFSAGENTLTKQNSNIALMTALVLKRPDNLEELANCFDAKDSAQLAAKQKIDRILLSPVLRKVFSGSTNFSMKGIVIVRLTNDMSRFDRFALANFLIANYKGQVVIPDFGFYGCPFHVDLIDQGRLMAGVRYLDENPLKRDLLLIDQKEAVHCLPEDAETLAQYAGLIPGTNKYNDFLERSIQ